MDQSAGQKITDSAKAISEMRAYFVFLARYRELTEVVDL